MSEQHGPFWEACSRFWCPRKHTAMAYGRGASCSPACFMLAKLLVFRVADAARQSKSPWCEDETERTRCASSKDLCAESGTEISLGWFDVTFSIYFFWV